MLDFTKTVRYLVIRTAQQIDTKLMHPFEKFRQNLLVKFYFMKDFNFPDTRAETEKSFSLGLVVVKNFGSLKPCHVHALEAAIRKYLCFLIKRLFDSDIRHVIDEDPQGKVKFVELFKITVLNLHVLMMMPEIKLIISAARLYWS